MDRIFEWDPKKAEANLRKHGIRFEDAVRVFDDPFAMATCDRIENGELRWQTIGLVGGYLMILVAHTLRLEEAGGEVIRIVSARRADRTERKRYELG